MAEDVVIRYRAEVEGFIKELNKIADEQEKILDIQKDLSDETKKNLTTQEFAAKKRLEILKKEEQALKILKDQQKLAFDPKTIQVYNNAIAETEKKIKLLKAPVEDSKKSFLGLGGAVKSFASGAALALGAAFSVQAIQQFASASIDAFLDAEKNAERLKFAITSIGGESEAIFDRLIRQSSKLQDITVFSDDSIQQAQAALSAFGLTGAEIEKTIPKLLDFATVQGVDVTQAAQQLGAGLEGAGKEFKKYEIQVSATASRQENLNSFLEGSVKFAGSAEAATKTYAGQLAVLNNRADELQEQIGEKLAPAFVKAKLAVFEAGIGFLNFLGIINSQKDKLETDQADSLSASYSALAKRLKESGKDIEVEFGKSIDKLGVQIGEAKKKNEELKKSIEDRIAAISRSTSKINPADDQLIKSLTKQREENEKIIEIYNARVKAIKGVIEIEKSLKKAAADAAAAKSEEDKLKNIELQKKLNEERLKEITKLRDAIEEDAKGLTIFEKAELDKRDKQFLESLEKKRLAEQKATDEKAARKVEVGEIFREERITELLKLNIDERIEKVNEFANEETANFEKRKAQILLTATDFEDANNKIIIDQKKTNEIIEEFANKLGVVWKGVNQTRAQEWLEKNQEILQTTGALVNELANLYSAFTDAQIEDIEREKDARLESIEQGLTANEENLSRRRISETEAANVEKRLLAEKVKAEEQADKKIRELKRKQAIADKAAALVQIAINTSIAIIRAYSDTGPIAGNAFAALVAALGAVQAAIVIAQPIPYAKGTKGAKEGLARVGEQGEEIMYVPGGTKVLPNGKTQKFAPVLDAMFDDNFDQYVLNRYVNPALQKQKMQMESQRSGSFAENIGKSLVNQSQGVGSDSKLIRAIRGGYINADEIGQAVAKYLPSQDIYRR